MPAWLVLEPGRLHHLVGDGRDHRHLRHLGAALHAAEHGLNQGQHGLGVHAAHLARLALGFQVEFAQLDVVAGVLERLLNLLLDLLRGLLLIHGADRLDHIALERHVHEADQERQHGGLVLRRHGLDRLAHRVELLATVGVGGRHVFQRHLEPGALQVVRQVRIAALVHLRLVDLYGTVSGDGIALDDDGGRLAAHVLDDHRQQQFADQRPGGAEVVHDVAERLIALLHLRLFLQARPCGTGLTHKAAGDAGHALEGGAVVGQHLVVLIGQRVVAFDIEARARLRHVLCV